MRRITLVLSRRWPWVVLLSLVVLAAAGGGTLGYFLKLDMPDLEALEDYTPPLMTRVLSRDGAEIATFAQENRILIEYRDIPPAFIHGIVATEDSRFFEHTGVDMRGILRAAWTDLIQMRLAEGASTVTQQLARTLFLHPEKLWRRKLEEIMMALEIERRYSKQEILSLYSNNVYFGHGQYGLEAAARFYTGLHARELELADAALLAGIVQRPNALTPVRHPERALQRRNHVLSRMLSEGFITAEQAAAATEQPLPQRQPNDGNIAPYFVEDVRRWLQKNLGSTSLYQEGLEVRTTLDPRLQRIANVAVEQGLRELDRRQGWRGVSQRVPEETDPGSYEDDQWKSGIERGRIYPGVVTALGKTDATVRVAAYSGMLTAETVRWTGKGAPAKFLEVGDIVEVQVVSIDEEGRLGLALEQRPEVEAALVAIEPSTGDILAMVGGFDFSRSEFNRATQARRQTGSAFKPFVYAAALSDAWTSADVVVDESVVFIDPTTGEPYQPENYSRTYGGRLTLRRAMEKSANIGTVKLLTELGYQPVIEMARRLGISSRLQPYPSLALGAFEVSLVELTSAYGTFANQGVRVEPHLVTEVQRHDGTITERVSPAVTEAVSPQVSYLMNVLLEGVVTDGTGRAARSLGRPLAGKTGTTDENTDAWFIGYAPDLALGVWVGFDVKRSLGKKETGAAAALPIWRAMIEAAYEDRPKQDFPRPADISEVAVHRDTGLRANPSAGCRPVFAESFIAGTEPTAFCSVYQHRRLKLPYVFHRFPIDEQGALVMPVDRLEQLLEQEGSVRFAARSRELVALTPDGSVRMEVELTYEPTVLALPQLAFDYFEDEAIDPRAWVSTDGRKPLVQMLTRPR